jgi:hypothetical protein
MDVKSIRPTAVFKRDLMIGQSIELEVGFMSPNLDGTLQAMKNSWEKKLASHSDYIIGMMIEAVKGWDTMENGKPVECTEENKKKHLPVMFGLMVKDTINESGEVIKKGEALGIEMLVFATNSGNFLNF